MRDHSLECKHFAKQKVRVESDKFNYTGYAEVAYDAISPLRVWLMSKSAEEKDMKATRCFYELESHLEKWKTDAAEWAEGHKAVFAYLTTVLKCDITFEELLKIYGIFYTNDFR